MSIKRIKNSNRGFTTVELMATTIISIPLLMGLLFVPVSLYSDYKEFDSLKSSITENNLIKTAVIQDVKAGNVEEINHQNIKIGNHSYIFGDKVYRDNKEIFSEKVNYTLKSGVLKLEGKDIFINIPIGAYSFREVSYND